MFAWNSFSEFKMPGGEDSSTGSTGFGNDTNANGNNDNSSTGNNSEQQSSNNANREEIDAVASKMAQLPRFWPKDVAVWFAQVEAVFRLNRITRDETKFCLLAGKLDPEIAAQIPEAIVNPPDGMKYENLKTTLIMRYGQSRPEKIKQVISYDELGDRKPSHMLAEMKHVAGSLVSEELLKVFWLQRLPSRLQSMVASFMEPLEDMAKRADHIVSSGIFNQSEIIMQPCASSSTTSSSSASTTKCEIAELRKEIEALRFDHRRGRSPARKSNDNQRDRSKTPRGNSQSQQRSRSHSRKRNAVCWYHYRFGQQATKCDTPCLLENLTKNE